MKTLSFCEKQVAEEYCKGYTDKEVADALNKSEWTIKAQKRDIYKKIGISKDTELVLYMLCERLKVNFDIKEIRKHGLELFFTVIFLYIQVTDHHIDMRRCRMRNVARVSARVRTKTRKNELNYTDYA